MSETTIGTYNTLTHQDGHLVLPAAWDDTSATLSAAGAAIGLIFDVNGLGLAGSLFAFQSFTLHTRDIAPQLDVTISVYAVDEFDPADYSALLLPGQRGEAIDTQVVSQVVGDLDAGDMTLADNTDFTFMLGMKFEDGLWRFNQAIYNNWRRFYTRRVRKEGWTGKLALSILSTPTFGAPYASSEEVDTSLRPRVTVVQWDQHTGFRDMPLARGRALRGMRSGLPALASELVEDGYRPGIWVLPDWFDEDDTIQKKVNLPNTEGKVRDKVPQ